jgi:hypothetical protein
VFPKANLMYLYIFKRLKLIESIYLNNYSKYEQLKIVNGIKRKFGDVEIFASEEYIKNPKNLLKKK